MDSPAPGAPQTKDKAWIGSAISSLGALLTAVVSQFFGYDVNISDGQVDAISESVSSGNWTSGIVIIAGVALTAIATKLGVELWPNKPL